MANDALLTLFMRHVLTGISRWGPHSLLQSHTLAQAGPKPYFPDQNS